jgi:hypothetical protein
VNFVTAETLRTFIHQLDGAFGRPGQIYLIGETSQVWEGWRRWTDQVQIWVDVEQADRSALESALTAVAAQLGLTVVDESPGDIIPLPTGFARRSRPIAAGTTSLDVCHFDPYSVSIRFLARGDEPDYHLAVSYLEHGWIETDTMERLLDEVLPSFSYRTRQQDAAELRRRYKGLWQMWNASKQSSTDRSSIRSP